MPSYRDAFPSKWLKATDCQPPIVVEIKSVGFEDVGSGSDIKRKLVMRFVDREQGWPFNKTNGDLLAAMFGTDDFDQWVGRRICLGTTKVLYQNKLVDGIRVQPVPTRKSRPPAARPTPPAAAPADDDESDTEIGF